jgi:RNA polymerase sigma-70 factor (ECF subfamily)
MVDVRGAKGLSTQGRAALIETFLERRVDLVRFFTLRLRSASEAEDLVQDIYLRLSGLEGAAEVRNPQGLLYRLGSNLMLDRLRSQRRRTARDQSWGESHVRRSGAEAVADVPPPDEALASRQRLASVIEALKTLPPQTQRVFHMHKFDGMSHPQVAEALGISRSAVEKHVMAALRRLSESLP